MSTPEAVVARKRELRALVATSRARRDDVTLGEVADALCARALDWPPLAGAGCVAAYVSVGSEPGTGPLLEALRARGVQVLLPVVLPGLDLDWAPYEGPDRLAPARRGLLEPLAERWGRDGVAAAGALVVPATAVDPVGHRLGQGGGCYDRALARVAATTPVAALLHDDEVLDAVPHAPHDRRVGAVITPTRRIDDLGG